MGAELLRIVDPAGRAIAWLAPGFGANCVGYAVREDGPAPGDWRHLLRAGSPRDLRRDPLGYGCAMLGPEPGDEGGAHRLAWRFVERDPTAATCAVHCGSFRLELTARLDDAALHLDLLATNEGREAVATAPGLRLCLIGQFDDTVPRIEGQSVASDGGAAVVSVAAVTGEVYRWRRCEFAGGDVAIEARVGAAVGAILAPGEQVRIGLVVAPR
jgi:hypothetical protein